MPFSEHESTKSESENSFYLAESDWIKTFETILDIFPGLRGPDSSRLKIRLNFRDRYDDKEENRGVQSALKILKPLKGVSRLGIVEWKLDVESPAPRTRLFRWVKESIERDRDDA